MTTIHSLACGIPCIKIQGQQTQYSIGLRITAIGMGAISALIGTLILLGLPSISSLGTTAGYSFLSFGSLFALGGLSIKHVSPKSSQEIGDSISKQRAIVEGSIAIFNTADAGALGENLTYLFQDTKAVERVDGQDWKTFPDEMLIHCKLFNMKKHKNFEIHLPLCLFIHGDDYTNLKGDGDQIEFYYDNVHYKLTIDQCKSPTRLKDNFSYTVDTCIQYAYEVNRGNSCVPEGGSGYCSPIALAKAKQMREEFLKDLPSDHLLHQLDRCLSPNYNLQNGKIIIECIFDENQVQIFRSDSAVAIYIPRINSIPGTPKKPEYLLILNFSHELLRECILKTKRNDEGHLEVHLENR